MTSEALLLLLSWVAAPPGTDPTTGAQARGELARERNPFNTLILPNLSGWTASVADRNGCGKIPSETAITEMDTSNRLD